MIEEQAVVARLDGEDAEVEVQRRSACGGCGASGSCGISALDRYFGRRISLLRVANDIGARPGDAVVIGLSETAMLRAALAAYLAPLLGLLLGAIGAQAIADALAWSSQAGVILGGLLGLVLVLRWLSGYSARLARDPRYRAVILRRADASPPVEVRLL